MIGKILFGRMIIADRSKGITISKNSQGNFILICRGEDIIKVSTLAPTTRVSDIPARINRL